MAPGAEAVGDVAAVLGGDFAGVAFGFELTGVDPPDFVGGLFEEVEVVGGEEDGGAGAAEAVEIEEGLGAAEGVDGGEGVVDGEGGGGIELEVVEAADIAGFGGDFDGTGLGGVEAGGEAEQLVDAARIFADDADESAVGGGDGNLL